MTSAPTDIQLTGETVTLSYVANPSVARGEFRLENRGQTAVTAVVKSAWFEAGTERRPLHAITLFDTDTDRAMDPGGFEIPSGSAIRFLVGFPRIAYEPPFGQSVAVGLQLAVDATTLQALSPIKFVRRIPGARP